MITQRRARSTGIRPHHGDLGLKGRFCQPRPKAWGDSSRGTLALKGNAVKDFEGHFHAETSHFPLSPRYSGGRGSG